MRCVIPVLALSLCGAFGEEPRQRPPRAISCERNDLTSYSGKVTSYSRTDARLQIRIRTDWDTDESFTILVAKGEDPAKKFLLRSAAFEAGDWKRIESAKGQLRPGMRATVWECKTGGVSVLTIDWEPPAPRENGG